MHFLLAFIILSLRVRNGTKLLKRDRLVIEFASFAVFLSIFCFDDVNALTNIS